MPRGGQNRKPTALKLIQGTHRKGRGVENEVQIKGEVDITPPAEFDGIELLKWQEVAPILKESRILTPADLGQLKNYCQQWAIIEQAAQDIRDNGVTVKGASGGPVKNPACTAMAEASSAMRALAATLGLEPTSRSKISGSPSKGNKAGGFADI